jgi:hypothetical protein
MIASAPAELRLDPDGKTSAEHAVCLSCVHAVRDHDAISHRYCDATQAQALARGCICVPGPG